MASRHDTIVIGAGHNGLVTAAYLARAGQRFLMLERREIACGSCVTEEDWPGFKVSTAAYVNSLLRPGIIRDLELKKHGFAMLWWRRAFSKTERGSTTWRRYWWLERVT